jgi:pseudouridine-5'-phosphate glycosidase
MKAVVSKSTAYYEIRVLGKTVTPWIAEECLKVTIGKRLHITRPKTVVKSKT